MTVIVGPQATGKSIFLQTLKLVLDRDHIRLRVWERGAGLTKACGTGACAALVATARRGLTERKATVVVDGGELVIDWDAETDHVLMTGPVEIERTGVLSI